MAIAVVRDLDDAVDERLKARAAGNNRSLEAELREILVLAAKQVDVATARAAAEALRQRFEGRPQSDSGARLTLRRRRPRLPRVSWGWSSTAAPCGAAVDDGGGLG